MHTLKQLSALAVGCLAAAISCHAALPDTTRIDSTSRHNLDVAQQLEIFSTLYRDLDMAYVDTLDAKETVGTAIAAMLGSLDPYTEYYPQADVKDLKQMITGKYGGIGSVVSFNLKDNLTVINEPYQGMPADEAGLKKGDQILDIDGENMRGKSTSYVSEHLRGEAGTSFWLTVQRPGEKKMRRVRVTRRAIQLPSLPYYGMLPDSVGYLALSQFTDKCSAEVRHAVIDLKRQGMRSLLLDLRNNGGGSLQEAVTILNLFLPKGLTLVTTRGKLAKARAEYKTEALPLDTVMPIAVLVNGETASASEITCGTLQDLDRGIVVGTKTFGKGLVQTPVSLPYSTNAKLTTAHYYIPSGRCIQAIKYKRGGREAVADTLSAFLTAHGRQVRGGGGITPDIVVKQDSMPNIVYYLSTSGLDSTNVMMEYVVDYVRQHPTIAPPSQFALTEADWQALKARIVAADFKYDRVSERGLKELVKVAKFEGYYDRAKKEFEALEQKLSHDLPAELDYHRREICEAVEQDIISCYYYQKGTAEYYLRFDKQIAEARRLLASPDRYRKALGR